MPLVKTDIVSKVWTDIKTTATATSQVLVPVLDKVRTEIKVFLHLDSTEILRLALGMTKDGVQTVWRTFKLPAIIFVTLAIFKYALDGVSLPFLDGPAFGMVMDAIRTLVHLQLERPLVRQLLLGLPMLLATGFRFGNTLQAAALGTVVIGAGLVVTAAARFDALTAVICLAALVSSAREHAAVLEACLMLGVSSLAWNLGAAMGSLAGSEMAWIRRAAPVAFTVAILGILIAHKLAPIWRETINRHNRYQRLVEHKLTMGWGGVRHQEIFQAGFEGDVAAILFEVEGGHYDSGSLSVKLHTYDASEVHPGFIDRPGSSRNPYAGPKTLWRLSDRSVIAPTVTLMPGQRWKQEEFAYDYFRFNSGETLLCKVDGDLYNAGAAVQPIVRVIIVAEVQGSVRRTGPRSLALGKLPPRDKVIEVMYRPPPK